MTDSFTKTNLKYKAGMIEDKKMSNIPKFSTKNMSFL